MAKRPRVFERDDIEAKLREQGVPESSVSETISFMRLVIPLLIQNAGADEVTRLFEESAVEWRRAQGVGWRKTMATYVVNWAGSCLQEYKRDRARAQNAQSHLE